MEIIGNVRVGKSEWVPSAIGHSPLVREGNARKHMMREPGIKPAGRMFASATVRRSTGINARARAPIDPRMPVLTPP